MTLWYSSHGLALGALLTIFLRSIYATRRNAGMMAAALALSGGLLRLIPNDVTQSMACELVFGALLLGALLFATSRFERWTRPRILLFFGEISYGLYLVHTLVFALYRHVVLGGQGLGSLLLQFVIVSAVSIGLATLSRFTVEAWFLSLKDKPLLFRKNKVSCEELTVCEVNDGV